MHPLQISGAGVKETMLVLNSYIILILLYSYITDIFLILEDSIRKNKYLHSGEAAQTSRNRCLDKLQPREEIRLEIKMHPSSLGLIQEFASLVGFVLFIPVHNK